MKTVRTAIICGTRPEAIKLAPLYWKLRDFSKTCGENGLAFDVKLCSTGQHREMVKQVFDFFEIQPDYELDVMKADQSLFDLTGKVISRLQEVFSDFSPQCAIVQGDTTTAFAGALCAFYAKSTVAHVEAGLRTFDKYSPFPEEVNRKLVTHLADIHFPPTPRAEQYLLKEGIDPGAVHLVGNTVIDAFKMTLKKVKEDETDCIRFFKQKQVDIDDMDKKLILVTGHRRESFGSSFEQICLALKELAETEQVRLVYPVHLNPNVQGPVFEILRNTKNVHLIEPVDYPKLVWLIDRCYLVLTDSGGVQEEAPSAGKPVLVMRDVTERQEGVEAGSAILVGTDRNKIVNETRRLLTNDEEYKKMAEITNPYGDGRSSERIADLLCRTFS